MINFDFPQFVPKKKKEEPLFIPIDPITQTSTPAYLPKEEKTSTLSNFLPSLSESARKFTAGGFKGLFSKEPAPTWKEAGKQLLQSAEQANRTKGVVSLNGEKREINAINPLAFLSTEPLKKIINPNLTTKFLEYAKNKITLSRQEIMDFARRPELKKGEADLLLKKLEEFEPRGISTELEPLIQEARKYKTAEEFVKAQGETLYHGTDIESAQVIEKQGFKTGEAKDFGLKGTWLTPDSASARYYANQMDRPSVLSVKANYKNPIETTSKEFKNIKELKGDFTENLKKAGYDAVIWKGIGKEYINILDSSIIKTKSQITNFYNQAAKSSKLPTQEFADSIRRDLLELKPVKVKEPQYQFTTIDAPARRAGADIPMAKNYEEVVFESPITTNGSSHFPNSRNYFAHARGDEVVEGGKRVWREQEIQSDLLQKDRLLNALMANEQRVGKHTSKEITDELGNTKYELYTDGKLVDTVRRKVEAQAHEIANKQVSSKELNTLNPFTNDRFGERIMRERIREKAAKGYEKYRLPTGETIGKIEGFSQGNTWRIPAENIVDVENLTAQNIKIGQEIYNANVGQDKWIITDILGNGRFKAVQRSNRISEMDIQEIIKNPNSDASLKIREYEETFDLTYKSNPQYRRYSDWGKFLKNKFGGKEVTDPQGNSWMEIDLKKEQGKIPIEAFGIGAIPFMPQVQQLFVQQDEEKKNSTPFMLKEKIKKEPKPSFIYESEHYKKQKEYIKKAKELQSFVPEQHRKNIVEASDMFKIPMKTLAALINTENDTWDSERPNLLRSSAQGLGQHLDKTFKDINKLYKKEFGYDYDRKNPRHNILATALWLDDLRKRTGDLDSAIGAYKEGKYRFENPTKESLVRIKEYARRIKKYEGE